MLDFEDSKTKKKILVNKLYSHKMHGAGTESGTGVGVEQKWVSWVLPVLQVEISARGLQGGQVK